jgi:membrane-bound lytic murein transglycosylase
MARLIPKEEHEKIIKLYNMGLTYGDIATAYNVIPQDIYHVLKHMCKIEMNSRSIPVTDKQRKNKEYVAKCLKEVNFTYNNEESFLKDYGMTRECFKSLTDKNYRLYKQYSTQRSNAKRRSVEFKLTFQEWLDIWNSSGKLSEKGKFGNNYVMARELDIGAYEVGNVRIIKTYENLAEININRALRTIMAHTGKSLEEIKEAIYG